jgi:predicted phage-related endonuclease
MNVKRGITMSTVELTSKIRQIKELQQLVDEANSEMDGIKDEIKAVMLEQDKEEIIVDVFKVRYTPVTTKRFDTTGFKKTHVELYDQYCKESTSRRFSVA